MKSLVDLLAELTAEAGSRCCADLSRDVETLRERVRHEGDGFITLTLPRFCSDFERGLDEGQIAPGSFSSFSRSKKAGVPAFLQGLLRDVFDRNGRVLDVPKIDCIRAVRQICLFGKKVDRLCSNARLAAAVEGFVQCENEVACPDSRDQLFRRFGTVADIVVGSLEIDLSEVTPKHGPGATRERISGNQKWRFRTWHRRCEEAGFTVRRFARGSSTDPTPEEGWSVPRLIEPGDEPPSRVVLVPKTQKGPRVIAVEPVCMQFLQQGLKSELVRAIAKAPATRGHVNFTDQAVNQRLALESSQSKALATLDMSEASDRVSLAHVRRLFRLAPEFLAQVEACRSTRAELPDSRILDLRKFASMGSALCFPVEALVFFVGIIASRHRIAGLYPTARSVRSLGRDVYVYGDDLIVPAGEAQAISDDLEALGFKVNKRKSFWTGKFRESCGWDCYGGEQVTPVYLRRDLPKDRSHVSAIISTVSLGNQLFAAGYPETANSIRKELEQTLGLKLPQVSIESAAIGWWYTVPTAPRRRWNWRLQRAEMLGWVPETTKQPDPIDGDAALAKVFRLIGKTCLAGSPGSLSAFQAVSEQSSPPDHLEMGPRPYALTLKRRWVPTT